MSALDQIVYMVVLPIDVLPFCIGIGEERRQRGHLYEANNHRKRNRNVLMLHSLHSAGAPSARLHGRYAHLEERAATGAETARNPMGLASGTCCACNSRSPEYRRARGGPWPVQHPAQRSTGL